MNKCKKCGGIIMPPLTPVGLTGKECKCGQEVNIRLPGPRRSGG